jgi:hypothetical protein
MLTLSTKKVKRIGNIVSGIVIFSIIVAVLWYMKANGANFS